MELNILGKKFKKFINNKNIPRITYLIQANHLIICMYYKYTRLIDFMLKVKDLLNYVSLFPPNENEKNDKIIPKCFQ